MEEDNFKYNNRVIEYYKENIKFGDLSKKLFDYIDNNKQLLKVKQVNNEKLNNSEEEYVKDYILQYGYGFNIKGKVSTSINKKLYGYIPVSETNIKIDESKVENIDNVSYKKKLLKYIEIIVVCIFVFLFVFELIRILNKYYIIDIFIANKLGIYTLDYRARFMGYDHIYDDISTCFFSFNSLVLYTIFKIRKNKRLKKIKNFDKQVNSMISKYNYKYLLKHVCSEMEVPIFKKNCLF